MDATHKHDVLVVEDEAALRDLIVEELTDEGFQVREAQHGAEAVEAILQKAPDLVLCDITMPKMDGHQFLTHVRSEMPHLADMPIIFLSALAERNDVLKGLKIGADDYITKPIDFDMLIFKVRSRLREVSRMLGKRDKELVKLYNAMHGRQADETKTERPAPAREDPAAQAQAAAKEDASVPVLGGRVFLVNLGKIRDLLGPRWPRYKDQVCGKAEKIIRQAIGPQNHASRFGDGDFVIRFADCDEREAAARVATIRTEVLCSFLGENGEEPCLEFGTETERLDLSPSDLVSKDSALSAIAEKFQELTAQAEADLNRTFSEIQQEVGIVWCNLETPGGKQTALRVPAFDWDTRKTLDRLRAALDDATALSAELDALKLEKLESGFRDGLWPEQRMVITTVSFSTVVNAERFSLLREAHKKLDPAFAKKLMFLITDVPSTVSLSDAALQPLSELSRLRGFHLKQARMTAAELGRLKPVLVAYDYPSFAGLVASNEGEAIVLVGLAKASGAKTLIFDLPDEARDLAERLEVDLVSPSSP